MNNTHTKQLLEKLKQVEEKLSDNECHLDFYRGSIHELNKEQQKLMFQSNEMKKLLGANVVTDFMKQHISEGKKNDNVEDDDDDSVGSRDSHVFENGDLVSFLNYNNYVKETRKRKFPSLFYGTVVTSCIDQVLIKMEDKASLICVQSTDCFPQTNPKKIRLALDDAQD